MATSRKKKPAKKKTPAKRRPAAKKRTAKKKVTKKTYSRMTWGKGVVHPVTKRPCGGRAMSLRDQKLFTRMGKRRFGVTPTKVREAYGLKKPAAKPKKRAAKKTAPKRRPAKKTAPQKRTTSAKKKAPRGYREKKVSAGRAKFKYVIFDASGRDRYGSNKLTDARSKLKELKAALPKAKLKIYEMRG